MSVLYWVAQFGVSFLSALLAVIAALHFDLEGRWQARKRAKMLDSDGDDW